MRTRQWVSHKEFLTQEGAWPSSATKWSAQFRRQKSTSHTMWRFSAMNTHGATVKILSAVLTDFQRERQMIFEWQNNQILHFKL